MPDLASLPEEWRQRAEGSDAALRRSLRIAADELELAYHSDRHDGEFSGSCRFCQWEYQHNDNFPDQLLSQFPGGTPCYWSPK